MAAIRCGLQLSAICSSCESSSARFRRTPLIKELAKTRSSTEERWDLALAGRSDLQPKHTKVDPTIEDGDDDAAPVEGRVLKPEGIDVGRVKRHIAEQLGEHGLHDSLAWWNRQSAPWCDWNGVRGRGCWLRGRSAARHASHDHHTRDRWGAIPSVATDSQRVRLDPLKTNVPR